MPMFISAPPTFDSKKLEALILCLSEKATDIGVTKLEKLMYLCDFEAIRTLGQSISGDTYRNFQWGPVPKHFKYIFDDMVVRDLVKSREISISNNRKFVEIKPISRCTPDSFSSEEWSVINRTLQKYGSQNSAVLVKLTHDQLPWKLTKRNEDIPDFLAFYMDYEKPHSDEIGKLLQSIDYVSTIEMRLGAVAA